MQIKVTGESPFQILSSNFTIGPSESGYDLMFSADGVEYSKLFTVGANTNRQVTQVAAGSYYFLSGNTDTVTVNWMKDCGGGSGGGSYVLPVASENTLGGVKIGSGLTMSGDTLNANPGGYTLPMASAAVLGGVKIGSGITIDANGVISADVQSGGAQEAKTIVLENMNPSDFTEDDIDAMQEMVDYLAEFPVDALPAARIFAGGFYYILSRLDYSPEDTENQTPEERYKYRFNYTEVYGDEGMDESQNGYIDTFFLNAENVEESYNMYWDSSEGGAEKLSAVEDPNELDARVGDVAAKNKSVVNAIHFDWSNLPFSEDMDVLKVGNLTLHAWDNDGTDTLTVGNGGDSYDFVDDGDNAVLPYTDNLHWSVLYESGDVKITLADSSSKVYFDEALITLNDCDAQYDAKVIPDGLYQFDEEEGVWKPLAKSIVINDILDGGQDKVAEFYAMMKPYMGDSPKGWPFNLYYRTKYFDMNPTLATLCTAWMSDYQSFGMENLYFMFEYVGYAHDFGSQTPDRVLIEVAEDGSYDLNHWDGISPPGTMCVYVDPSGDMGHRDASCLFDEASQMQLAVKGCELDFSVEYGFGSIVYARKITVNDVTTYYWSLIVPTDTDVKKGVWHTTDLGDMSTYTLDSWTTV